MQKYLGFIFIACSVLLASCAGADPDVSSKLNVYVTPGEADVAELTFTVVSENASNCAWMCVAEGAVVPSGEEILQKGKVVFANTSAEAKATGLKDNTTYVILAAAMNEVNDILVSEPVRMTTLVKPAEPAAVLSNAKAEGNTFSFRVTPTDAEKCFYKLYSKGQNATADDVLSTGTEVSASEPEDVTLTDLADGEYFVVAVAKNGDIKTMSEKLNFLINTAVPTYTIQPIRVYCSYKDPKGTDYVIRFNFVDMKGSTSNIALDFVLAAAKDYVPAGKYDIQATSNPKLDPKYTEQVITGGVNGGFVSGYCNVRIIDGKYTFDVNLLRAEDESFNSGEILKFTWTGEVESLPIV